MSKYIFQNIRYFKSTKEKYLLRVEVYNMYAHNADNTYWNFRS